MIPDIIIAIVMTFVVGIPLVYLANKYGKSNEEIWKEYNLDKK